MKRNRPLWKDPIVEEVGAAGAKIAKECDYDIKKMIKRFRMLDNA